MSKIFINLENDELHKRVKVYAARNKTTIKEVIKKALVEYMKANKNPAATAGKESL